MRRVNRKLEAAPACLSKIHKKTGLDERTRAIQYYVTRLPNSKGKRIKSFDFGLYSDLAVREAMERLFHGKCAYCDNSYDALHPVEVEHWRPKAEVMIEGKEREWHHGYYWLGSDWDNLLPACIDCNRERYHIDIVSGNRALLGKKNWFPVADERNRWRDPGVNAQDSKEQPLLLNPCLDHPKEFLRVNDDGVMEIRPRNRDKQSRARASIQYYALNRPALVKERKRKIKTLQKTMADIRVHFRLMFDAERRGDDTTPYEDLLAGDFIFLEGLKDPKEPFSALAEQMIDEFRRELAAT